MLSNEARKIIIKAYEKGHKTAEIARSISATRATSRVPDSVHLLFVRNTLQDYLRTRLFNCASVSIKKDQKKQTHNPGY